MSAKKKITVGGRLANATSPGRQTIVITAPQRGNIDIETYIGSIRLADNIDFPKRVRLLDLCESILLTDAHLSAIIHKRKAAVLNQTIEFKRDGKTDEAIDEQLRSPWFYNFISDLLDTPLFGFSFFQFYRNGAWIGYNAIPRKHIDPVRKQILRNQTDLMGEPWDSYEDCLFVGKERDFGLLANVAPYAIYKRNALADWAQYAELFGQPLREGEYDGYDDDARKRLVDDLFNLGSLGVYVHPTGTKLTLHESSQKGDSAELFKSLTSFCDEAESKAILGNTLTTQASEKGTQALGSVQKKSEDVIINMDRKFVLNVLNYELTDIFLSLGLDTRGGEFAFAEPNNIELKERIEIDRKLFDMGLPLSDDYLYERYGIEKPADYETLKSVRATQALPSATDIGAHEQQRDERLLNRIRDFFVRAPKHEGASDW